MMLPIDSFSILVCAVATDVSTLVLGGNRLVNNVGIIGKEGQGRMHEMNEETWDFIM